MKFRKPLLYQDEDGKGKQVRIQSIELESGSGRTWNIKLLGAIGEYVFWSEDGIDKFFLYENN